MPTPAIGVICGQGEFPALLLESYRQQGYRTAAILLAEEADPSLADLADRSALLSIERIGRILRQLRDWDITHIVFAGKVHKRIAFTRLITDTQALRLLARMRNARDATMMLAIIDFLEEQGFEVVTQTRFMESFLAPAGPICGKLSKSAREDLRYGRRLARIMADEEIGQTLIVHRQSVVAVEALEGTDETIRRAGTLLKGRGGALVKVERSFQDPRFDIPVFGRHSILAAAEAGIRTIGIESGGIFLFQRPEVEELARRHRICIWGMDDEL